jgi:trehalose synthase
VVAPGRVSGHDAGMQEVEVKALPLERLAAVLPQERANLLMANAARARDAFGDRVVWHVNATASGGGVAEMLQTLLAYGKGGGIENRWLVLDADPDFFSITKRIHNLLHGVPGDGGVLGEAEHDHYRAVLAANLETMLGLVDPRDLILLHDPQPAGLTAGLQEAGLRVAWRCHVGRDEPNPLTDLAWEFLRGYVERADAFVFSRRVYAPRWAADSRLVVIPPSIDPFSTKNMELGTADVDTVLAATGLVTGGDLDGPVRFQRRDGTPGLVRRPVDSGGLVLDGPAPPRDVRLVVQVSRWDLLKDMSGVMTGFAGLVADGAHDDCHLMLLGPAVSGVTDDPEGAEVLARCREDWSRLPVDVRERVHLASVPMDDVDENAVIVNAVQRHAYAVVQKSLVEGFGLTVTEAMWKGSPVVASRVGGIQDQIVDGRDGLLVDDPRDLAAFAATLGRVLDDETLAERLGRAAHERVRDVFLGDRHLAQYVDLFTRMAMA